MNLIEGCRNIEKHYMKYLPKMGGIDRCKDK